ncbi:MAG: DMT family transporter [Acholeplasmataceae bacterium]
MPKYIHLAGIAFSTIFGFSFMFSKIALNYTTPVGVIAYRFLVAFLFFELLRRLKITRIHLDQNDLKKLLRVALLQPVLYFLLETYGLNLVSSSEAGMMIALIPIFVTILSALILQEKARLIQVFFIILSVSGVLYIQISKADEGLTFELAGFFLLLGAVIAAALFNIASRDASKTMTPQQLTYFMMLAGAISFNAIYLSQLVYEQRLPDYITNLGRIELIGPILYLGIVASIGGFFLVNVSLRHLPAHISSIYANLATVVAIVAGVTFLRETLEIYHYIGSAMILIGVYGTVRTRRVKRKKRLSHGHI